MTDANMSVIDLNADLGESFGQSVTRHFPVARVCEQRAPQLRALLPVHASHGITRRGRHERILHDHHTPIGSPLQETV